MKAALQQDVVNTFDKLYKILSGFPQSQLNNVPFEGSWTGGQVTEHIIKATSGLPKLCSGKTETITRKHDEKVDAIKNLFLDFTVKMESPEFIVPTGTDHEIGSLTTSLKTIEKDILEFVQTQDLTLVCLDFELPGFGSFTKYEWISFAIVHTQRHTRQLEKISQHFAAK